VGLLVEVIGGEVFGLPGILDLFLYYDRMVARFVEAFCPGEEGRVVIWTVAIGSWVTYAIVKRFVIRRGALFGLARELLVLCGLAMTYGAIGNQWLGLTVPYVIEVSAFMLVGYGLLRLIRILRNTGPAQR
jgi:hypothetical protein